MNRLLAIFSVCMSFCFLLEGIDLTLNSKKNRMYKMTHILYSLFITVTLFYFLYSGVIE